MSKWQHEPRLCKDCKWWEDGSCNSEKFKVILDSIDWYEGSIYIPKDFGCIHWEDK